ncbi:unnamed protein product [Toxocara canis]|uniref:Nucleotid_trans domain-containing protein n=1 Tax=Toxocara canis TaxID=6265 RepID=A0A183UHS9_TOXCA|nr:unnamed protein product [Toxocara canis]
MVNSKATYTISLLANVILLLLLNNILRSVIIVNEMNICGKEFEVSSLLNSSELRDLVNEMKDPFGVMMLNAHALDITLNWLCNTAHMDDVHRRTLFFTLDEIAQHGLLRAYPKLHVFRWNAPCLKETFKPGDTTYMSFFLLRTNLIRALLRMKRSFWMIQADTIWRGDLYTADHWSFTHANVLLDQQGHQGSSKSRKRQMNGANFLVIYSPRTLNLIEELFWYQSRFYVTDPDVMKIMCNKKDTYRCQFINHSIISGWEWVYGNQEDTPLLVQMDGETRGGKVETLRKYNMWFLNDDWSCNRSAVSTTNRLMLSAKIPRLFSSSKLKQKILLATGEFLGDLPIFGPFYRIYGGLTSLYLQFF